MHFPAAMQCVGIIRILTIQMSRATRYTLRLKLRLLFKLSSTKTYNTQFGDVGKINFLKIATRCFIIVARAQDCNEIIAAQAHLSHSSYIAQCSY